MGQTLTHGIYLPDEGERNCYNGLAANWQLLDGAVGTVAEHTTALAGKAPAVHTHTKADITDFPVYGTTAGTICEGNDSRLSDARTPVAHTHTKSDITDLLNSNFIPSANNSYDLGSASYQWKSIYAESYYYNGTAWGLNKSNTWGESNTFTKRVFFQSGYSQVQATAFDIRTNPEVNRGRDLFTIWDGTASANGNYLGGMAYSQETDGSSRLQLICFGYPTSGNAYQRRINFHSYRDGSASFYPVQNNITNLGTSTNKWKSLNGINPGALSFPNLASDGYIELSDSISANTEYAYTPAVDGWLALYVQTTGFHAENAVAIFNGSGSGSAYRWACSATSGINLARLNKYHGAVILPVRAGIPYLCWIKIDSSTTLTAKMLYFYKATGNV